MPPRAEALWPRCGSARAALLHPVRAGLLVAAVSAAVPAAAEAKPRAARDGLTLECINIRRLSDNVLLDLRIRMQFDRRQARYARFENTGRGWQMTGVEPVVDRTSTRIVLADTPWSTAYIERLTGDYYVIDRTGTVLSVWGRCGRTHPLQRLF